MTAIESATSKVSVPETPLIFSSQYPAIASRSIWNPLAPVEGVRDLVGRVIIIATVFLLGYFLIKTLFSRCWRGTQPPKGTKPEDQDKENLRRLMQAQLANQKSLVHLCRSINKNDVVLHKHDQSISLPKDKILDLCDVENLREEECIYAGDLTFAKERIELLMKNSNTQRLVEYICQKNSRTYAMGALFVFLGIKPALAIETKPDKELFSILKDLTEDKELDLCLRESDGSSPVYFVNENPFPSFNPREFLNLSPNVTLTQAVADCFSAQGQRDADQFLSYLLGFGPSWETYANNARYLYEEKDSVSCIFSKNHYYDIGKVLNQALFKKEEVQSEIESLGFTFHTQIASLIEKGRWEKKESLAEKKTILEQRLSKTGTNQILDGLTARTDYFKKSYTLKKWVMETYFPQLF